MLVGAIESGDKELSADAAYFLVDEPALILTLSPPQMDRIAAHTGGDQWGPELARIIERDRAPRSYKKVAALERYERVHRRRLERFSICEGRPRGVGQANERSESPGSAHDDAARAAKRRVGPERM